MFAENYSIEELAELTGFDKRVIRSFIEQGLMRGPDSKGRYARYTETHVIRLRAIRQLREQRHMSMGEVRAALLTMSDEDIKAISAKASSEIQKKPRSTTSVLEYLRSACAPAEIDEGNSETHGKEKALIVSIGSPGPSAVDRLMIALNQSANSRATSYSKGQRWHRFSVTPDIEISVRGLQDGGQVEQWDRIADCLRDILLGGA